MPFTNFQTYKVQAWAVLTIENRPIPVDLTRVSASYPLNGIPQGTVSLALGRNIVSQLAAAVHFLVNKVRNQVPIEVYVLLTKGPNSFGFEFESWPAGPVKVFSGFVTSAAYQKNRDGVSLQLGLQHWLGSLQFSSCLTRQANQLNPQQLSGSAGFLGGGTGVMPAFSVASMAAAYFLPETIQRDMWGEAFGPWLQQVCQEDVLADPGEAGVPNTEALDALTRFEPFAYGNTYRFGSALVLPLAELLPTDGPSDILDGAEQLATAIAEDVAQETFESMLGSTIWDKLLQYHASYGYSIVPLVDTALVVPAVAGYRVPWQNIHAQEYAAIGTSSLIPRPVKSVRVLTGVGSVTGALGGLTPGQGGSEPFMGGQYDNPEVAQGMIRFENAPRWAANMVVPSFYGPVAAAAFEVRGSAMFPGVGNNPNTKQPADIKAGARNIWDAYARYIYIAETLRGRTLSLQGKFRLDIAPGSTVRVSVVEDKFVNQQTALVKADTPYLYGEVMTVSLDIDSEAPGVATTFQLANVRSEAENRSEATSTDRHPLFFDSTRVDQNGNPVPWNGAPLAEHDEFIPVLPSLVFSP